MTVYYVEMPFGCNDLDCIWTKKEDAINYLIEEAENNGWKWKYSENYTSKEDFEIFAIECYELGPAFIYPMFLDEKPYFYPNEK